MDNMLADKLLSRSTTHIELKQAGRATAELWSGKSSICCTVSRQQLRSLLFHTGHLHDDDMDFLCLLSSPGEQAQEKWHRVSSPGEQAQEKSDGWFLPQSVQMLLLHLQTGCGRHYLTCNTCANIYYSMIL